MPCLPLEGKEKENNMPLRDATQTQSQKLPIPNHRKSYGIPALQNPRSSSFRIVSLYLATMPCFLWMSMTSCTSS